MEVSASWGIQRRRIHRVIYLSIFPPQSKIHFGHLDRIGGGEGRSGRQPENIDLPLEGPLFALWVSVCGMGLIVAITDYTHKLEIRYRCAIYPRIIVEHNTCRWRFTRIFLRRTHQLFSFSGKSAAEPTQQR